MRRHGRISHRLTLIGPAQPSSFEALLICHLKNIFDIGESNTGYNQDKYSCTFSKMIAYWRQTWNQHTNGNTNIQFPFRFVQASSKSKLTIIILLINDSYNYQ